MRKIYLVFIGVLALFNSLSATTTSGITTRNVNVSDGLIIQGATAGSNSVDWETDEVFPGFQNIVNWYLTWDDNNLYVGRLGGNNAEGSLIYLRADKQGFTFSNTPQAYDNFSPDFTNMGGINFIAYIKEGYNEFRTFSSGSWSGPSANILTPSFNTPSGQANSMELAIPWNSITHGNGKPENLRAVFYQVVPSNLPLFAYGESPWGTGVAGNGPSVGVNDGAPTSAAQPGGSIASNATITRWWGCYPVISGVGANGFVALQPNAGQDIEICSTESSAILDGNEPAADAIGTWSLVESPALSSPIIANPNLKNTSISSLTQNGIYKFVWNINYGRCPATPDTVVITRFQAPIASNAGPNQTLLCGVSNATVTGNNPGAQVNFGGGLGTWVLASGAGTIASVNSPTTNITNIGVGLNKFVWRITNGPCIPQTDTVEIFRFAQPTSVAGTSQTVCGSSTVLQGNNPLSIQSTAIGQWTQVSGPNTATIANAALFNTGISNLQNGIYTFKWKLSNGNCLLDSSNVTITVFTPPVATLGGEIKLCNLDSVILLGNNPSLFGSTATGIWSLQNGASGVSILDPTNFTTEVNGLQSGDYVFEWKLNNGICPADSATIGVSVYSQPTSDAGVNQSICQTSASLNGNNPIQIQGSATGIWAQVSGPNTATISLASAFNPTLSNLINGNYSFDWIVSNGNCASDTSNVTISVFAPPNASIPSDLSLCNSDSAILLGNNPNSIANTATGIWTLESGDANAEILNPTNFTTQVDSLIPGVYQFKWKVSNGVCPSDSATMNVSIFSPVQADAGSSFEICGNSLSLSGNDPAQIQQTATGTWTIVSGPAGAQIVNPTLFNTQVTNLSPGQYIFKWKLSNGACNADSSTVTVTVGAGISAVAGVDQSLCGLTVSSLFANSVVGTGATGIWSQISGPNSANLSDINSNNPNLTNLTTGTYSFQWLVNTPGCPADSDVVQITISKDPSAFISPGGKTICGNQTIIACLNPTTIQSTATGSWTQVSGPSTALFSSNTVFNPNVSSLEAGNYIFNYTVTNGSCPTAVSSFSLIVSSGLSIKIKNTVLPDVNQANGSIELIEPVGAINPVSYFYNYNNSESSLIDSLSAGSYYIKIKDNAGCEADTLITLKNGFFIPTGISPNGDNMNETWEIPGIEEYTECTVQIFNQWGGIVYESKNGYKVPWDGLYNGKKLPEANYYYLIDLGDGTEKLNGRITLAR